MIMKKYIKPSLRIVMLDVSDLIATSTGDNSFTGPDEELDARVRHSAIWDD